MNTTINNHKQLKIKKMQVLKTTDYSKFKSIDGNRNKNLKHINKLRDSMNKRYLMTILIVNERNEIIDGQHRFEVIKELNLPMYYIVCHGYRLDEVHILNQTAKVWKSDDYLQGYIDLGYTDYLKYKEFKEKYGFGHNEAMSILGDLGQRSTKDKTSIFNSGQFKVKNMADAVLIAERIKGVGNYYSGYARRSFVFAMLNLFKNKNFKYDEFIHKLSLQPNTLKDCPRVTAYLELIEEIYNFRRRDKVNLRY